MKKLFAVAALTLASGCATQTFVLSEGNSMASYDKAEHFFVGGIGQQQDVNASEVCGGASKVAKVQSEVTFLNGLLSGISYNIYTPHQSRVFCK